MNNFTIQLRLTSTEFSLDFHSTTILRRFCNVEFTLWECFKILEYAFMKAQISLVIAIGIILPTIIDTVTRVLVFDSSMNP